MVEYGVYHADFTPWNMSVEGGNCLCSTGNMPLLPTLLDRYHFFTQTAIFVRSIGAAERLSVICSRPRGNGWREKYKLYLIGVMARFILREKGKMSGDMKRSFDIWLDILNFLNQ